MTSTALAWFKSSYSSGDDPDCVEVAISPTAPAIHVRDSKDTTVGRLTFTDDAWSAFLDGYSA
ncbi:DUF397 domain-containing protein [Streptomyces sp. P17]|uniref:DUF397 domain-containing protein n=1 Tax=Streptomyces sp. P17 TaxID=3074716 RepID=UPI0028F455DA|nr:DUF397 domain-containing protein [Streptomyces sp. P17]MDT9697195.1 DUF397 domain-containing protein [Streptomyces sp. P17]